MTKTLEMVILNNDGRATRSAVTKVLRALRPLGISYKYVGPHREHGSTYPSRWYVTFTDATASALDAALAAAWDGGADIECYSN